MPGSPSSTEPATPEDWASGTRPGWGVPPYVLAKTRLRGALRGIPGDPVILLALIRQRGAVQATGLARA